MRLVESSYCTIDKEISWKISTLSLLFNAEDVKVQPVGDRDKWRADIERVDRCESLQVYLREKFYNLPFYVLIILGINLGINKNIHKGVGVSQMEACQLYHFLYVLKQNRGIMFYLFF